MKMIINPTNRDVYLDLLLLADEQLDMLKKYMYQGDMFVLLDNDVIGVSIVIPCSKTTCEIKNIAIHPLKQHLGYGKQMITYIINYYQEKYASMLVGTGANTSTITFYEKCGFIKSYLVKDFFTNNYDHVMYEDGIQLKDMQYLERKL